MMRGSPMLQYMLVERTDLEETMRFFVCRLSSIVISFSSRLSTLVCCLQSLNSAAGVLECSEFIEFTSIMSACQVIDFTTNMCRMFDMIFFFGGFRFIGTSTATTTKIVEFQTDENKTDTNHTEKNFLLNSLEIFRRNIVCVCACAHYSIH